MSPTQDQRVAHGKGMERTPIGVDMSKGLGLQAIFDSIAGSSFLRVIGGVELPQGGRDYGTGPYPGGRDPGIPPAIQRLS